jgi:hypothetical protein
MQRYPRGTRKLLKIYHHRLIAKIDYIEPKLGWKWYGLHTGASTSVRVREMVVVIVLKDGHIVTWEDSYFAIDKGHMANGGSKLDLDNIA